LAIEKKIELRSRVFKTKERYQTTLVLIQLPNDDSKLKDAGQKTKEELVPIDYLKKKVIDVDNRKVALMV
jgi:type III restriction enzyme